MEADAPRLLLPKISGCKKEASQSTIEDTIASVEAGKPDCSRAAQRLRLGRRPDVPALVLQSSQRSHIPKD